MKALLFALLLTVVPAGDGLLGPLNAAREVRGLDAVTSDELSTPVACGWAAERANGAQGLNPALAGQLNETIGDSWVRAHEVSAVADSVSGVWGELERDERFIAASVDGSYNRIAACFEEGSAGTAGVLVFIADRAAPNTQSPELPDEPLQGRVFSLQVIGASVAVAISLMTLLFTYRRRR